MGCDPPFQLSTNEQTRKEKTSAVETLHAEIDQEFVFKQVDP